jgi:hypothetical protein
MAVTNSSYDRWREASLTFWLLTAFLILVFFTGGSPRADVQSLGILRPVAIFVCGIAICRMRWEQVAHQKLLLGLAIALLVVVSAYLIPVMPFASGILPKQPLVSEVNSAAGITPGWRAISLAPTATLNALFALFVPFAVALLGAQLTREERFLLLPVLIALGAVSVIWGVLQALAITADALYPYQITNRGFAVGLFANRNHQAMLLAALLPMMAAHACINVKTPEQSRFRAATALAASIILIPLLLITGSRIGLVLGVVGLVAMAWIYRSPNFPKSKKMGAQKKILRYAISFGGVFALGLITALASRAEALRRILVAGPGDEIRFQSWGTIAEIALGLIPTGAGPGAFSVVFQVQEPLKLLRGSYLNQAHNDLLDVFLTTGIGGVGLAIIVVASTFYLGWRAFSNSGRHTRDVVFARVGVSTLLMIMIASLSDYPLRSPFIACFVTVALLWASKKSSQDA